VPRRDLVAEATAVGAAIVGGVGVGIFDDFTVAGQLSAELAFHEPEPARHERYAREYGRFMEAYRRLEPWFHQL